MEEDSSKFVRGFSITAAGSLFAALMAYVSALVAVTLLGPNQYGLFSLAIMVPNVLISFLLVGLDVTATKFIAHNLGKEKKEHALLCAQTIFIVRLVMALLSMIVLFLLSGFLAALLGEDITLGLNFLSVYVCFYLVAKYLMAVLQGYFLIKERVIAEVVLNTLNVALLIPFVYVGFGYLSPIASFLVALVGCIVLLGYYLKRAGIYVFRLQFQGFHALKEYLKFSFYVYLSDSFHIVYVWVGALVITLYAMPVETVGYYRAMFSITNTILLISYGLTITLYPMLSELNARKDEKRLVSSIKKVIKYALALSIPSSFGLLLVSKPVILILFPDYLPAVTLLRIFSFRMIFLPLWAIFSTALITLERERQQALLSLFLCSSSFLMSIVLGRYSVEGIAVANTAGIAGAVFLQYVILKRRITDVSTGPVLKFLGSTGVMCVVVWTILQVPAGNIVKVVVSLVCGAAVYCVLVLRTGAISREDLEVIRRGLSAFGRAKKIFEYILDLAQKIQK